MTSDELRDMAERLIEMADEMDGIEKQTIPYPAWPTWPSKDTGAQRNYDCSESLHGDAD